MSTKRKAKILRSDQNFYQHIIVSILAAKNRFFFRIVAKKNRLHKVGAISIQNPNLEKIDRKNLWGENFFD